MKKNQSGKALQEIISNRTAQGKQRHSTAEDANNDRKEENDSKGRLRNKQYWRKKRNSKKQGSNHGSP
jgi:hypothetical protein